MNLRQDQRVPPLTFLRRCFQGKPRSKALLNHSIWELVGANDQSVQALASESSSLNRCLIGPGSAPFFLIAMYLAGYSAECEVGDQREQSKKEQPEQTLAVHCVPIRVGSPG